MGTLSYIVTMTMLLSRPARTGLQQCLLCLLSRAARLLLDSSMMLLVVRNPRLI
jgi:hypothetical protein